MAALRLFARSNFATILRSSTRAQPPESVAAILPQVQKRWSRFHIKDVVKDPSQYTDVEVSRDPKEWEYVERLLRPKTVPKPPPTPEPLPSGFVLPTCKPGDYPYHITRTRNYMYPVYLKTSFRGQRKVTAIRKIDGDIWVLHKELKDLIANSMNKSPGFRVNELAGDIHIRGDFVNLIKQWMLKKGF